MKNLILNELNIYLKDRKTQSLSLALIIVACFFTFIVSQANLGNLGQKTKDEIHAVKGSLDTISEADRLNPAGSRKYELLVKQESLISILQMSLIMEMNDTYLKKEANLNELQLQLSHDPAFADTLSFIPPLNQLEITRVTNQYLKTNNLPRAVNNLSGVAYTIFFSSLLLTILSVIIIFFASDILISDYEHQTVIRGFPVSQTKRIWAKIITRGSLLYLNISLALLVGFITMSWRFESGPFDYPVGLYVSAGFTALPFSQYLIVLAISIPSLIMFILLMSTCLNILTKNLYLTLFIQLALFILPNFIPLINQLTYLLPFNYLNLQRVLTGELANVTGRPQLDFIFATLVFISWSLLLSLLLHYLLKNQRGKAG